MDELYLDMHMNQVARIREAGWVREELQDR